MNKLLIPLCYFITSQAIYDGFGEVQNTNWSIFYYTSQYIAWLLLVILLPKPVSFVKNLPFYAIGIGLIIYIVLELGNLGSSYEEYYINVNSFKAIVLPISAIIAILTTYIIKLCQQ